jgi:hypothetical protein
MDDNLQRCVICRRGAEPAAPLFAEDFYPDTWYHLACMHSSAGAAWIRAQKARDPLFKRYNELMTQGLPVQCPTCAGDAQLYPKATGWAPYDWEMNCDQCDNFIVAGFNAYTHPEITEQLEELFDNFLYANHLDNLDGAIADLAGQYDYLVTDSKCTCGGNFSIKAKPRCKRCRSILFDTYFHYADQGDE